MKLFWQIHKLHKYVTMTTILKLGCRQSIRVSPKTAPYKFTIPTAVIYEIEVRDIHKVVGRYINRCIRHFMPV